MRTAPLAIGVIAFLVGLVWVLQGVGILKGSTMTGSSFWLGMGVVLLAVGIILGVWGARTPRAKKTA